MAGHPFTRRRVLLGAGLAGAAVLAACVPDGGPDGDDLAPLGDIEIVVWDQEVRTGQTETMNALNDAFAALHPTISVKRYSMPFDDLRVEVSVALGGSDVPDVLQVNNARGDMGQFVQDGHLVDLTPYAERYGWTDRFPASVLAKMRYSATSFGEGALYGLPHTGEIVGFFYSRRKLDALGAPAPSTWDELLALLDAAAAADEQPMVLGNSEIWPALHAFGPLQAHYVDAADIARLAMGTPGASWTDDGNTAAMAEFERWCRRGYFGGAPNDLGYDDAWTAFARGTGVLLPAGSWLAADLAALMGDDVGFLSPPPSADGSPATTGGTGIPFCIPAKALYPEAAAAYLDHLTGDDAMEVIAANGLMPVLRAGELAPSSGVHRDVFEAFDAVTTSGTLLPYLDYATPTFPDTSGLGLRDLIAGQRSAAEVLSAFESDYRAFVDA